MKWRKLQDKRNNGSVKPSGQLLVFDAEVLFQELENVLESMLRPLDLEHSKFQTAKIKRKVKDKGENRLNILV